MRTSSVFADARRRVRQVAPAVALCLVAAACSVPSSATSRDHDAAVPRGTPAPSAPATPKTLGTLRSRVRPDVMVVSPKGLAGVQLRALRALAKGGFITARFGTVAISGQRLGVLGADPAAIRPFMPQGTAEVTQVWDAVARGEAVVAHDIAERRKLKLGGKVRIGGREIVHLRLGAIATSGLPDVGLIVTEPLAARLGAPATSVAVLSSGRGDPTALAAAVRRIVGDTARISLLSEPTGAPTAMLRGGSAAKAFGAFSYRYHSDGTIEPDARWVDANIVWATVPILGRVRCHRLFVPQLRAALAEIQRSGLTRSIRRDQYGGCYVPRFIERDPNRSVSLHTWGIAVDFNVPTNMPGSRGDIDRRVVAIFKKWGMRWGGDWSTPDPMHFELGALMTVR